MTITGIDALVFGVEDMKRCCTFFDDWGLKEVEAGETLARYHALDDSEIVLRPRGAADLPPAMEDGPTLRRAIWGVEDETALNVLAERLATLPGYGEEDGLPSVTDPAGLRLSFRVRRRIDLDIAGAKMNTADAPSARKDTRGPVYERARPVGIGHYVLFVPDVKAAVAFYTDTLGFLVSDCYPDAGYFLRSRPVGGHHQLFLLQTPDRKAGLNHVAYTVRDIHEVFGGGLNIGRHGWETQIGPGRHPISSAYFWYVHCPAGGLAEYFADEDWCTEDWQPQKWERTPEHFAEWAIAGGIDAGTRRQVRSR